MTHDIKVLLSPFSAVHRDNHGNCRVYRSCHISRWTLHSQVSSTFGYNCCLRTWARTTSAKSDAKLVRLICSMPTFFRVSCYRRKRSQNAMATRMPTATQQHHHQQKGAKLDSAIIISQNNNPDYRSQPPFCSKQDLYTEDNEYAYVEEFQFKSPPICTCPRDPHSVSSYPPGPCDPYAIPPPAEETTSSTASNLGEREYEKTRPCTFSRDGPPQYFVLDPESPNSTIAAGRNLETGDKKAAIREDLMVWK